MDLALLSCDVRTDAVLSQHCTIPVMHGQLNNVTIILQLASATAIAAAQWYAARCWNDKRTRHYHGAHKSLYTAYCELAWHRGQTETCGRRLNSRSFRYQSRNDAGQVAHTRDYVSKANKQYNLVRAKRRCCFAAGTDIPTAALMTQITCVEYETSFIL